MFYLSLEARESLVKEYFPDAPDRCARCPALAAAAMKLAALYEKSVDSIPLIESDSSDGDREQASTADYIGDLQPAIMSTAEELFSNCPNGSKIVYASDEDAQITGMIAGLMCRSDSPVGFFTPLHGPDIVLDLD